jgi:hypothetical protein
MRSGENKFGTTCSFDDELYIYYEIEKLQRKSKQNIYNAIIKSLYYNIEKCLILKEKRVKMYSQWRGIFKMIRNNIKERRSPKLCDYRKKGDFKKIIFWVI